MIQPLNAVEHKTGTKVKRRLTPDPWPYISYRLKLRREVWVSIKRMKGWKSQAEAAKAFFCSEGATWAMQQLFPFFLGAIEPHNSMPGMLGNPKWVKTILEGRLPK